MPLYGSISKIGNKNRGLFTICLTHIFLTQPIMAQDSAESEYGAVVNWGLFDNTNLALEYLHGTYDEKTVLKTNPI